MGVMADAIAAYAQPLLDETDGSLEEMQKALSVGQLCWNLALLPEDERESLLVDTQQSMGLDGAGMGELRRSVIDPMIRRHNAMFPGLHSGRVAPLMQEPETFMRLPEKYPGTERYAPCPCNSGRKYKFCCGKRG